MSAGSWLKEKLLESTQSVRDSPTHKLNPATLLTALERAARAVLDAVDAAQATTTTSARVVSAADAAAEQAELLRTRERDVEAASERVRDALERAKVVALNAGLDGARLQDPVGKVLMAVADEVRTALTRAMDALDEHDALAVQVEKERGKLREQVLTLQRESPVLRRELEQALDAERGAAAAVTQAAELVRRSAGADEHTARWIARATEHALELRRALAQLPLGPQSRVALRSLRTVLEPLEHQLRRTRATDESASPAGTNDEP
jgi:hypothetical protein